MPGTGHHLAPAVAMQQPVNGTVIDCVPDALFNARQISPLSRSPHAQLARKTGQEFLLFFQREILSSSATFARRFNSCETKPVVTRDDCMNRCFGHSTVPRKHICGPWLDQRIV